MKNFDAPCAAENAIWPAIIQWIGQKAEKSKWQLSHGKISISIQDQQQHLEFKVSYVSSVLMKMFSKQCFEAKQWDFRKKKSNTAQRQISVL